ncbi:hypothetical protein BGX34_002495 [Mortierella sp. NVP85]|nr:hypothetical protein BGX34_002495 [Mortierella sp. NVP85]
MTSLKINPLDIPEIRSMVGQYLGRSNLARCLRVCKSWHASFMPLVWSTTKVWKETSSVLHNPPLEAFIRYSHHLKDLYYYTDAPEDYRFTPCPNLLRLKVDFTWIRKVRGTNIVPVQIAPYEKLRYLSIYGVDMGLSRSVMWEPVHYHNLSELELHDLEIKPTCTATFWDLCAQLASLKIEKVSVAEMPARSIIFDRLQRLELELKFQNSLEPKSQNSLEHQLDWITQCPNLSILRWYSNGSHLASSFVKGFIRGTSTWDNLRELMLMSFEFTDGQLARIIGAMRELRVLDVYTCEVGSCSLKALRLHSQSLTSLIAMDCDFSASSFVPGVLASFPHLEYLAFDSVMSQDIIDGPPWACERSLKVLVAGFQFDLDLDNQDLVYHQRQVLQKVSRLTNLKELHLTYGQADNARDLDLRLENGLDQLATLEHLEKFVLCTRIKRLSVIDVKWMIDNWKNLKEYKGYLNTANKEEQTAMLQAAGINCTIY